MLKSFPSPNGKDTMDLTKSVDQLTSFFESLTAGTLVGETYREHDLEAFLESLVSSQQFEDDNIRDGFWTVAPDTDAMPSDARDDFIHNPTTLAIGILFFAKRNHEDLFRRVPGAEESLQSGLDFALLRNLSGHGCDALDQRLRLVGILAKSGIIAYLKQDPGFHPEFTKLLDQVRVETRELLALGQKFTGLSGEDERPKYEQVLKLLG